MACYTQVLIDLTDNAINRLARKHLGIPETGSVTESEVWRIRTEAGVIRTHRAMLKLAPNAVIRRTGNTLTISVSR